MITAPAYSYELDDMLDEIEFLTQRRQVIAENIANIDTPDYRAQDLLPPVSSSQFDPEMELSEQPIFVTDPQHIAIQHETETRRYEVEGGEEKLNGNNVVLEKEMVKSNEISNKLDRISNIYNKTRAMLKQVASGK